MNYSPGFIIFMAGDIMSIDFEIKDVVHKIAVKFIRAFLPNAKKPFNLRAVKQPVVDIHGIASKAEIYNIHTNPRVIEEGLIAGFQIMYYLAADGYKIKTPVFNLRMRIPGEYNGSETLLWPNTFPVAILQVSADLRKYLREKVTLEFEGMDTSEGFIAEAKDEATGLVNKVMTRGDFLTIRGTGLSIRCDEDRADTSGLFFIPAEGKPVRALRLATNEPKTLKALIPCELIGGVTYHLAVETQSSLRRSSTLLKTPRRTLSNFTLTAA